MEPKHKILLCPNRECKNIPDIKYIYNPYKPMVKYKCNKHNRENEIKTDLSEFLEISSHGIICGFCKNEIINNNIYFCSQCEDFYDYLCLYKHNISNRQHKYFALNQKSMYDNCLKHNNTFIFGCINCNESLCALCDLNFHNNRLHVLKQLINFSSTQNEYDRIISDFEKQKYYLNKIKEMNKNIINKFENDIIIKEKIIENYKNNKFNFQSIKNFSQLKIIINKECEKKLKNIIDQYDENKNNLSYDKDSFINQIISSFYYNMMINPDQNNNNELINFMKNIFKQNNENDEDKNIKKNIDNKSLDNSIRMNKIINNKRKEKEISNKIKKDQLIL